MFIHIQNVDWIQGALTSLSIWLVCCQKC